jgi:hypothetical protein
MSFIRTKTGSYPPARLAHHHKISPLPQADTSIIHSRCTSGFVIHYSILCPGGAKTVDFCIYLQLLWPVFFTIHYLPLGPLASLREPNIFFHFSQLFLTFPLFFDTFHQNHPKTTPLFNTIFHFLTTFCRFLSLFVTFSFSFSR